MKQKNITEMPILDNNNDVEGRKKGNMLAKFQGNMTFGGTRFRLKEWRWGGGAWARLFFFLLLLSLIHRSDYWYLNPMVSLLGIMLPLIPPCAFLHCYLGTGTCDRWRGFYLCNRAGVRHLTTC